MFKVKKILFEYIGYTSFYILTCLSLLLLLLLLAEKANVSRRVDAEGQDNASHRSEEEDETDEEGQEKEEEEEEEEMEEEEEKKEEESGAGTTKKTVPGTCAVCRTWVAIGLCIELY